MNKFENILLFGIGINKFEITNWSEKKPKLLDLINLSDDDVIELSLIHISSPRD